MKKALPTQVYRILMTILNRLEKGEIDLPEASKQAKIIKRVLNEIDSNGQQKALDLLNQLSKEL